ISFNTEKYYLKCFADNRCQVQSVCTTKQKSKIFFLKVLNAKSLLFQMENSPLQTPAPRRYAPVPMSKDGKVQQDKGTSIVQKDGMTTRVGHDGECHLVLFSSGNLLTESFPAFVAPSRGSRAAASPAVQKATDVLHDLGKLKSEMHGILQPKRTFSSSKLVNPSPTQKPSLLQAAKAPASMFEDAERILRAVQSNKKCLEENLQSIVRGKDSTLMYSLVDTLAANSDAAERLRIRKTVDAWIAVISHDIKVCWKGLLAFISHFPIQVIADPDAISSAEPVLQGEDYLRRVYGKALYQGHRSTSKKGPYLRFNSPAPKAKPQRPKMVENTKGVKVKSARTQTNPFPVKTVVSSPTIQRPFSAPLLPSNQYLFSPSNEMASSSAISGPVEGHLLPMAIPLGIINSELYLMYFSIELLTVVPQPVTLTTSIPPKPQLRVRKPNAAVVHVKSEKKSLPKLCVQVLPNVDIDSLPSDSPSASHRSSSPEQKQLSPQPAQSLIKVSFNKFPFLLSVDQDNEDALPEPSEPGIELEGFAGSVSLSYHGTPFPPSAPAPQPVVDIVDRMIQRKESIENQLVEWVEQELMSQIISEMYPFQPAPVPHVSNRDESEESLDSASDIVEAAGGSGLQLFVDAGVPVDSGLVRQFVNEALAEIVAIMLGQRESQSTDPVQEGAIGQTPSPVRQPGSSYQEFTAVDFCLFNMLSAVESPAKVSPVGTPAVTPVPTPSRVSTPSLVTTKDACQVPSPQLPNPWGDAELPLEEENPNSRPETSLQPRAVCMSVAKDEEPETLILPPRPVVAVPEQSPSTPPQARTTPPSTEESSSTISTETADRNISEGEVLISYGQIAAAKGTTTPSRARPGFYLNSDDENSAGQISEGQMPQLTAATERILTGHSQYMNPFAVNRHGTSIQRRRRLTSPGQLGSQTGNKSSYLLQENLASYHPTSSVSPLLPKHILLNSPSAI
uniref:RFX5 N-terminal domain-containing protein n=1 Tax=Callorhinchus milii TaxID=7868 RepID=A0A4W3GIW5_CALMI